jgi:hypothetical protein
MILQKGIKETEEVATYLRKLVELELREAGGENRMLDWLLEFLEELHYTVQVLIRAIRNQSKWYLFFEVNLSKPT